MSTYYTYNSNLRDRNKFTSTVNTTYGHRRYFSSLDTEVYFGSKQMDEIVAIDFTISEPKLPIYGFNSFYANRIVSGRRTIQGTFAINFTHTLDLLKILQSIDDSVLKASYLSSNGTTLDYESLVYRCEGEDSTGLGIGNNAIFSKMFDITISYGYGKTDGMQTFNSCYQTLVGVQIVDYRQALDTEGNPILDMYSFIAKDLRYQESVAENPGKGEPEKGKEPSSGNGGDTGSDPTTQPPLVEDDYIVANKNMENEMEELTTKCQNTDLDGFIINPFFNSSSDGKGNRYVCLELDCVNSTTETFTDVMVTLYDLHNGINVTIPFKDINKGIVGRVNLTESLRDVGELLYKLYKQDSGYKAQCIVEFMAKVGNTDKRISYTTLLFPPKNLS